MPVYSFDQIRDQINQKRLHNIYLLQGSETFFTEELVHQFQNNILNESEKAFNLEILYGSKDIKSLQILDSVGQYPLGSDQRLVIVRNAQEIKDIKNLENYTTSPYESSILVLVFEGTNADGRNKYIINIKSHHAVFDSKGLYDNQMAGWIQELTKSGGKQISSDNATLIAEFLGTDLRKVYNEIQKIIIATGEKKDITREDIESFIGINREFNVFELQSAIFQRNPYKAQLIARYLGDNLNKQPFFLIISSLYTSFTKLFQIIFTVSSTDQQIINIIKTKSISAIREYKLALNYYSKTDVLKVFDLFKQFDQFSKGVGKVESKDSELLKELVFKLIHIKDLPEIKFKE